ncbi:MAG: type II toxin-antitoxin system VapC family toxin [Steroidobacteraceae bacterium]
MRAESAYIDTSVLGAYYCAETLSAAAQETLRAVAIPVVSTLCEVEFSCLIARKRRGKELRVAEAKDILALFAAHLAEGFYRRIALASEHCRKARELIDTQDLNLRTLDALHLGIVCVEDLELVTADRQFARAAAKTARGVVRVAN